MADIVNLRQARKARRRAEDAAAAQLNRNQHGRSKAERATAAQERQCAEHRLDLHRRHDAEPDGTA